MTAFQKVIKYSATALAIFLAVNIIVGILNVIGLFGGFFDGDAVSKDLKTYEISSDITSLNIEINAADLSIKQSDKFSVESNLKNFSVTEKSGTLTLKETRKFGNTYNGAVLTVYVPYDTVLKKADITTGAGRLNIETLSADYLALELGAGEVKIQKLFAYNNADIDGGAGKITISDSSLHNLDLDMGVGQLNLVTSLSGSCGLDLGVGESNLTLLGGKEDYTIAVEKGIGSLKIDGENASDFDYSGNKNNSVDIDCGIGAVNLAFKKP